LDSGLNTQALSDQPRWQIQQVSGQWLFSHETNWSELSDVQDIFPGCAAYVTRESYTQLLLHWKGQVIGLFPPFPVPYCAFKRSAATLAGSLWLATVYGYLSADQVVLLRMTASGFLACLALSPSEHFPWEWLSGDSPGIPLGNTRITSRRADLNPGIPPGNTWEIPG